MKAMMLEEVGRPLVMVEREVPEPNDDQVLIKVKACGVCRTDLHIFDGELTEPKLPLVLGHEIVGIVEEIGSNVTLVSLGDRVGVPWLGWTCGECRFCRMGKENLCENAGFTGYTLDGGYAEYTVADPRYCFPVADVYEDAEGAPLLCAGLIGYRSYRMTERRAKLGLYGFGAAAHIIAQIAAHQGREVYAFTKPGDERKQRFARKLGAVWAGGSDQPPPEPLDATIIFAPVGPLVVESLEAVRPGGIVVCAGIYMSDIPSFPYELLWEERQIRSVANLTRQDGIELFEVAPEVPVKTEITRFPLSEANEALEKLRQGDLHGAAVLVTE
jgi:propanol-preferring alcohol dehydrogenase